MIINETDESGKREVVDVVHGRSGVRVDIHEGVDLVDDFLVHEGVFNFIEPSFLSRAFSEEYQQAFRGSLEKSILDLQCSQKFQDCKGTRRVV